ncbi:hypothetical protein [Natrinema hispanicum]|uniref:hypothetical protein n=1 Tax=Natrinema hispanicum TaxID=392421 RepID=UPI001F5E6C9D|nr:hypothetical protein [Natrinema hispanicum]
MAQLTTGALLVFLIIAVALVSLPSTTVQSGDVYTVQLTDDALQTLLEVDGVDLVPGVTAETDLETLAPEQTLVEIILTAGSDLIGETIDSAGFSVSFWGVSSCFGRYEPAADRADSRQPAAWLWRLSPSSDIWSTR